jgi:hypothetical protein
MLFRIGVATENQACMHGSPVLDREQALEAWAEIWGQ